MHGCWKPVDKQWAAKQIKDVYTISNCLTLHDQWDIVSPDLVKLAVQKGFAKSEQNFDYARDYSDFIYTNFGKGRVRCATTLNKLGEQRGRISVGSVMNILRHHNDKNYDPQSGITGADVCMHAGFGPIRGSQSTASLVVHLDRDPRLFSPPGQLPPAPVSLNPFGWIPHLLLIRELSLVRLQTQHPCIGPTKNCTAQPCSTTPNASKPMPVTVTPWKSDSHRAHCN